MAAMRAAKKKPRPVRAGAETRGALVARDGARETGIRLRDPVPALLSPQRRGCAPTARITRRSPPAEKNPGREAEGLECVVVAGVRRPVNDTSAG
jgi:hypothetical protein